MLRNKLAPAWQKGFTLIELLVVIGILGILIAVVLVAVNPSRQFASARDTQRRADLYAITNAMYQYATEHNGNFPDGTTPATVAISTTPRDIGTSGLNLGADLMPNFIPAIPQDPGTTSTPALTRYFAHIDANGRLVATAASELHVGQTITVAR
jgi:prepilin-type N-terminal cleavage/methylation domain-containing protein